jgi:hypothetical protein
MLSVLILIVVMLFVLIPNVVTLTVVAPKFIARDKRSSLFHRGVGDGEESFTAWTPELAGSLK